MEENVFGDKGAIIHEEAKKNIEKSGCWSFVNCVHWFVGKLDGLIEKKDFIELVESVFAFPEEGDDIFWKGFFSQERVFEVLIDGVDLVLVEEGEFVLGR